MQKAYARINWENYPSEETPVNASNLNRIDAAVDEIDDRVITLDITKLGVSDANDLIKSVALDNETGVITITKYNNSTSTIETNLSKIALNMSYDYNTQQIILSLSDGTEARIDLSSLIQNNEFYDSDEIAFTVAANGRVTAAVKANSITEDHLQRNFLADIRVAEANAAASETQADADAIRSQSWAVGNTQTRQGEDTDNSKYYSQLADSSRQAAEVAKSDAEALVATATARLTNLVVQVNLTDGNLYYDNTSGIILQVDTSTGALMYDVSVA